VRLKEKLELVEKIRLRPTLKAFTPDLDLSTKTSSSTIAFFRGEGLLPETLIRPHATGGDRQQRREPKAVQENRRGRVVPITLDEEQLTMAPLLKRISSPREKKGP